MAGSFASTSKWKQRWFISYILDYLVVILFILGFSAMDFTEPFHQRFSLNNESLQFPLASPERISPLWAGVISCLFPLLCIIFWTLFLDGLFSHHKPASNRSRIITGPWTMDQRLWEMNCGILGLGLSVAGAICITGALKNATGKPRPDIIARCLPREGAANHPIFGLVDSSICTQTDHHILRDGFRSWPSGHSSTAFAGLGYLSLYFAGKLHIMDNRGEVWKTVLVLVPLLAASLVAVSRIMDARHHPFDVITGSMLGWVTAWISYRQYFPSVSNSKAKGRAYPRRTWGTSAAVADEESAGSYSSALNPRVEDGRLQPTLSQESFDSETNARKRGPPMVIGGRTRTFESSNQDYELDQRFQTQAAQGSSDSSHAPRPPPHTVPHVVPQPGNPFNQDIEYRGSVDMGETRRNEGPSSPEGFGRVGRISPTLEGGDVEQLRFETK